MENKILPSSSGGYDSDSCGARLGKRISRPADLPVFSWPPESRLKENGPLLFTAEENAPESTVNQSKSAQMVALGDCFQHNQLNYQNSIEGYKIPTDRNAQENVVGNINQNPLCRQLQHEHPHFPTREMPESLSWVSKTSNMLAQADAGRSSSKSDNSYAEKSEFHPYQGDLVSGNLVVTSRAPLEMHNVSTGVVIGVGAVEQIFPQHHTSYASSHGRGCPEEANRFGNSCVSEQSLQCSNRTASNNPSYGDILSGVSASTNQKVGGKSLHNEAQNFIGSSDNRVDNLLESRGRSHMECDTKKEDLEAIGKENIKSSLTDEVSSKHGHSPSICVQHVESNKSKHSSLGIDEKSRLLPSNKMSPAAEKLWEGSLQLNASVTAPVVAFFKSGEKLLGPKWSEFVEVKGKVRLDAFEKYIKDLPRSRSRGLMVISICFKEGSSEKKGLKGMEEVAKGYMKGERVGFANLAPGVDVYLCPRSDKIITILAKYGFFKGMKAVEEGKSELMIGCVVWRKNPTAKKSVEKASSLQTKLQKLPSDSSMLQQGGEQGSLSVPSVENSNTSAPLGSFSIVEQANVTDDKSVGIDSTSRTTTLTASGVKSPPPFQQKESELSSSHLWGSKGHLLSSEASYVRQSYAEPPKESTDLPKPVTSLPPNASKRKRPFSDDDDLPEFDFGTASGISSSFHHSGGSILGRLQPFGRRIFRPVAPSVSMNSLRSVISIGKGTPLARNVNDHGQLVTASRQMEEKHNSRSHPIPAAVTVCTSGAQPMVVFDNSGKDLFNDDDMPEWFPPDAQNEKTNEAPNILPPESSNSTSRTLPPPLPTGSVFPYPSSATTTHNRFSSQPSPPLYHMPANSRVPPPIPSQDGPSYLTGFTFNPVPGPVSSSSLAAASSLQPADKRIRKS